MLKRNSSVKAAPQRCQDNALGGAFDVVFAFEEKVFDMVLEGFSRKKKKKKKARVVFRAVFKLEAAVSWEDAIDDIVAAFERQRIKIKTKLVDDSNLGMKGAQSRETRLTRGAVI
ncbi:hypothetical protein ACLOJK_025983 [Asimina triloba]